MTAFATTDDVATILQRDLTTAEEAAAQLLLDLVSAEISDVIGVTFDGGTSTVTVAGNWGQWLELPAAPSSITAVAINGTALDTSGWFWKVGRLVRRGPNPAEQYDQIDSDDSMIDNALAYQGARPYYAGIWHWGGDASTVELTVVTPSTAVPAWLKSFAINLVKAELLNPGAVESESLGAYSVRYVAKEAGSVGILSPDQMLFLQRRYRRPTGTIVPTVR